MNKIIPFKKEIKFDNNIYEVTSISLEHTLHKDSNDISGDFIVSGEYRITDTSTNTIPFSYNIPFTITLDDKYNIDNSSIDIDDFYYEIVDNKILVLNIEVKIDKIEEILIKEPIKEDIVIEELPSEELKIRCIEEEDYPSLFSNVGVEDNYVNYRVYIVRGNDTLDSILNDYQVTKEELASYNDITNIKVGDKIIIPYVKYQ